jgi:hypothetical protein
MASELLTKLKELKKKITELNNKQFKMKAVELLKADKVEEKLDSQLTSLTTKLQSISEAGDGEEPGDVKKAKELRKMADKERKNFDLAKEYAENKKEYSKEKVVDAVNNLIIGKTDVKTMVDAIIKDGKGVEKTETKGKK